MIKGIPGHSTKVRLFERVRTVDPQYNIYDVGLQYEDDSIDSIAAGGSFASAKRWLAEADAKADKSLTVQAQIDADEYAVKADLPFINVDGTDVPVNEQRKVATTV